MQQSCIPQHTIQNRNGHIFVLTGGICEIIYKVISNGTWPLLFGFGNQERLAHLVPDYLAGLYHLSWIDVVVCCKDVVWTCYYFGSWKKLSRRFPDNMKLWNYLLELPDHSEIWLATQLRCCWDICQISEWLKNFKPISFVLGSFQYLLISPRNTSWI